MLEYVKKKLRALTLAVKQSLNNKYQSYFHKNPLIRLY
jgi:hypothetical protein